MKFVYGFGKVLSPDLAQNVSLLGNKGALLCEMTSIGLNVPKGFIVSTRACQEFFKLGKKWPNDLEKEISSALAVLEKQTRKKFGSSENPLFVSVRSGSPVSMPGMMDTILNVGMSDLTVEGFSRKNNNVIAALDSYLRFLQMFGKTVFGLNFDFENSFSGKTRPEPDLRKSVIQYKKIIEEKSGKILEKDYFSYLKLAVSAVFESWNTPRAAAYRKAHKILDSFGTAVVVQEMVFGNLGNDSGTGVAFTRNPLTGEKELYGEFLFNAQGEDLVSGISPSMPIKTIETLMPNIFNELLQVSDKLEEHFCDMQDFEFTVEKGKLFILQTRPGKRSPVAALKIAKEFKAQKSKVNV